MPKLKNTLFLILIIFMFVFFSNKSNVYAFSFFDWFSKDSTRVLGDDDNKEEDEKDEQEQEDESEDENKEEDINEIEDEKETETEDVEDTEKDQKQEEGKGKYEYEQTITNDDGTQTLVKIKKENGKEKVEVKKYDTYGNKISESKFESENKTDKDSSENKEEAEVSDFESGVFSNIKLETKDKKVLELKTSKSKDLSKVEFEVAKGEVKIKYKNEATTETENEMKKRQEVNVKVSEDGFELEENNIIAKINFPISIDQEKGKIYIQTNKGQVFLSILPEQALQQIVAKSQSFTPSQIQIEENNLDDKLTYNITGTENQNLLGLFSVDIFKTFNVDATDGEIVSQDQSIYNRILDLLSV